MVIFRTAQSGNLKKRWKNYNKKLAMKKQQYGKFRIKNYICIAITGFIYNLYSYFSTGHH